MNDSLYIAATGMHMQQKNVDTIANNLANMTTPGYKKGRVTFQDMVYREMSQVSGANAPAGGQPLWQGGGVSIASMSKLFTAGDLKSTGMVMDLAIQGDGFLEVTAEDGSLAYTRGGSLMIDKDGFLATADGRVLKPGIHVGTDSKSIAIKADGTVMVQGRDQSAPAEVGRIELTRFADATGLLAQGNNLYKPSERSGDAMYGRAGEDGNGTLAQGFQEASNVNMVEEMVALMAAQRAYETSVKVIQASDEMLGMSNNLRK
jgi:flagellar basal-body rod protein FlgG